MYPSPSMPPIDWVKRVNRSWIVRSDLNERADAWLEHLAALDDGRLLKSCQAARAMCEVRKQEEDPKPWFYAGLFQFASAEEARRFLETHRLTKATVPAMADDEGVRLWLERAGPETHELLDRLRAALRRCK